MSVANNFNKAQVVLPVPLLPITIASPSFIIVLYCSYVNYTLKLGIFEIIVNNYWDEGN